MSGSSALLLAIYDLIFTFISPLTALLAEAFIGWPLHPAIGFRLGIFNSTLGLGDLLVYSLFLLAAYKAYGPKSVRLSLTLITLFGAVAPGPHPAADRPRRRPHRCDRPGPDLVRPGRLPRLPVDRRHYGRERTMREFLASGDLARRPTPAPRPVPIAESA